jgi:hypothetical protein
MAEEPLVVLDLVELVMVQMLSKFSDGRETTPIVMTQP